MTSDYPLFAYVTQSPDRFENLACLPGRCCISVIDVKVFDG